MKKAKTFSGFPTNRKYKRWIKFLDLGSENIVLLGAKRVGKGL